MNEQYSSEVRLSTESIDEVTCVSLKMHYDMIQKDLECFWSLGRKPKVHEWEDYRANIKLQLAMAEVMDYYGVAR